MGRLLLKKFGRKIK